MRPMELGSNHDCVRPNGVFRPGQRIFLIVVLQRLLLIKWSPFAMERKFSLMHGDLRICFGFQAQLLANGYSNLLPLLLLWLPLLAVRTLANAQVEVTVEVRVTLDDTPGVQSV